MVGSESLTINVSCIVMSAKKLVQHLRVGQLNQLFGHIKSADLEIRSDKLTNSMAIANEQHGVSWLLVWSAGWKCWTSWLPNLTLAWLDRVHSGTLWASPVSGKFRHIGKGSLNKFKLLLANKIYCRLKNIFRHLDIFDRTHPWLSFYKEILIWKDETTKIPTCYDSGITNK